ncbi:MAG: AAA family ATPase [Planctomycetota bacterium]|jgi:hypothetical protein
MRIRSLRIANFRGVGEQRLTFPETGVVVIEGPNEIGKSSLVEAFDLLLDELDSSKKAKIKATQPVDRDAGPEVEAEIEAGPYRFRYRKRFLKGAETVLHVTAPHPQQLTGRAAHERVTAILDETMDRALWNALRVEQTHPLAQPSLADAQSLAAALDRSAGQESVGEREATLFDRVEEERLRYFTATGRPGKALTEAEDRQRQAEATLADAQERLAALQRDIDAVAELERRTAELEEQRGAQEARLEQRRSALDEMQEKEKQIEGLELRATGLTLAETATRNAFEARAKRIADTETAQHRCAELEIEAAQREPELRDAEAEATAATAARKLAQTAADETRRIADLRAKDTKHQHYQLDLRKMRDRRKAIDDDRDRRARAEAVLEATGVDDEMARRLRGAHGELQRAEARAQTRSPRVRLRAARRLDVAIDGEATALAPDEQLDRAVPERLELAIDGVLHLEIQGGAGTEELRAAVAERRAAFDDLLREARVADLDEAEAALRNRTEAGLVIAQCDRQIRHNLDDLTYDELVNRIGRIEASATRYLAERPADPPPPDDYDAATTAGREARARATAAEEELRAARTREEVTRERHTAIKAHTEESRIEIQVARRTLELESGQLARERDAKPDDAVRRERDEAAANAESARDVVRQARGALGSRHVQEARQLAENAEKAAARTAREQVEVRDRSRDAHTRIELRGGDGLFEAVEEAKTRLQRVRIDREALVARADAARLLHETMSEERERARRAYAAPLREKIGQLGRLVFQDSFAVELDEELAIRERTLHGRTIPFNSLSVGAREQLGLVTRLACALLVDEEQGVPVVLDDTLGSSDPERLEGLGAMLHVAGERAQVIVLTCTPGRFRHIGDATVIRL